MPRKYAAYGKLLKYYRELANLKIHPPWSQARIAKALHVSPRTYAGWEGGESLLSPEDLRNFVSVLELSEEEEKTLYRSVAQVPPDIDNLPYQRNPFFTGREEHLEQLRQQLQETGTAAITQPVSISGLGGIGKTELALEYAHRYYPEVYRTVLWVDADTATLQESYADLSEVLKLPERNEQKRDPRIQAVKDWLATHTNWLLIMDNANDLSLAESFLPSQPRGHVLFTTKSQIIDTTATRDRQVVVEEMEQDDGLLLLLRRSNKLEGETPLDTVSADQLVELLGGLPLALDQAGAYIEETGVSFTDYVERYHKERRRLLNRRRSRVSKYSKHPQPVATTFELSFTNACEQHPLATDILNFCAFLHPDAIPEELFQHGDNFMFGTTEFDEAIAALRRYSLIKRNAQEKTLSMHRLVQDVLIDVMSPDLRKQWRERVVRVLNEASPVEVDLKQWRQYQCFLPHVKFCATWAEDELAPIIDAGALFHKTGIHLRDHMFIYSTAETLLERAVAIYEQLLGVVHPDTANALYDLAVIYHWQDKYSQAERIYAQIVVIWERLVGTEHLKTARSLHNLLAFYLYYHKNDSVEAILGEALCPHEQDAGTVYSETARGLHKLVYTYLNDGDSESIKSAYDLIELMLSVQVECLGDHPETARSLRLWAQLNEEINNYELTEAMYREALTIFEHHLEADHPDIASSLTALARVLHYQERHEEAEALYQRALHSQERQSGATHSLTQSIKMQYASFLRNLGRDAEAAVLEVKTVTMSETTDG